jgi:acyl carrier protein
MNNNEIFEELHKVFIKVFKYKNIVFSPSLSVNEINDWSSLKHIMFIDAIEKHFCIKFKLLEIINLKTMQEICNGIIEKIGNKEVQ